MSNESGSTGTNGNGVLARYFETWREEFRAILEDHRREIRQRLDQIEREIEKKSDKDHVDLVVRSLKIEIRRNSEDIKTLYSCMARKMGTETVWRAIGVVLTVGGLVGGLIGFLVHFLLVS